MNGNMCKSVKERAQEKNDRKRERESKEKKKKMKESRQGSVVETMYRKRCRSRSKKQWNKGAGHEKKKDEVASKKEVENPITEDVRCVPLG